MYAFEKFIHRNLVVAQRENSVWRALILTAGSCWTSSKLVFLESKQKQVSEQITKPKLGEKHRWHISICLPRADTAESYANH